MIFLFVQFTTLIRIIKHKFNLVYIEIRVV